MADFRKWREATPSAKQGNIRYVKDGKNRYRFMLPPYFDPSKGFTKPYLLVKYITLPFADPTTGDKFTQIFDPAFYRCPSPIHQWLRSLENGSQEDKELREQVGFKNVLLTLALNLDDIDAGFVPHAFPCGRKGANDAQLVEAQNDETRPLYFAVADGSDFNEGTDVEIQKSGKNFDTTYTFNIRERATPVKDLRAMYDEGAKFDLATLIEVLDVESQEELIDNGYINWGKARERMAERDAKNGRPLPLFLPAGSAPKSPAASKPATTPHRAAAPAEKEAPSAAPTKLATAPKPKPAAPAPAPKPATPKPAFIEGEECEFMHGTAHGTGVVQGYNAEDKTYTIHGETEDEPGVTYVFTLAEKDMSKPSFPGETEPDPIMPTEEDFKEEPAPPTPPPTSTWRQARERRRAGGA